MNCVAGANYDDIIALLKKRLIGKWAARSCFPYEGQASISCYRVEEGECSSQLPPGNQLVCIMFLETITSALN